MVYEAAFAVQVIAAANVFEVLAEAVTVRLEATEESASADLAIGAMRFVRVAEPFFHALAPINFASALTAHASEQMCSWSSAWAFASSQRIRKKNESCTVWLTPTQRSHQWFVSVLVRSQ